MSENEIKPVAWRYIGLDEDAGFTDDPKWAEAYPDYHAPLYDQSAIDRLTAERDELRHERGLLLEQIAKTEERADFATAERDVLRIEKDRLQEIRQQLEAERDDAWAAVDANWVSHQRVVKAEVERDAAVAELARVKASVGAIHYGVRAGFSPESILVECVHAAPELAAIDAARSLDDSPMARMASALREKAAVERSQYDKRVQSGEWGPMPELGAEAVFCVACDGVGWDGDSRERTCQSCAGSGLAARAEGGV